MPDLSARGASRSRSPVRTAAVDFRNFPPDFRRLSEARDGRGIASMLAATDTAEPPPGRNLPRDEVIAAVFTGWRAGGTRSALDLLAPTETDALELALDSWSTALKVWSTRFSEADATTCQWMLPPFFWFCSKARRVAVELDAVLCKDSTNVKKLVEILREQFQSLHRDRLRPDGCLVVCCELLRLYFHLKQPAQGSFLLKAVSQVQRCDPSDLTRLPKALGVTLSFLWGKHAVLDCNVVEAEQRLVWAFQRCPPKFSRQRGIILRYLIPCRLRHGIYPSLAILERYGLVTCFAGIVQAVSLGDVALFDRELLAHTSELIQAGTFLIVEKLRLLALRNLAKRVYHTHIEDMERRGKVKDPHKQDLRYYYCALKWQDDCDTDEEAMCALARLIYIGAIRAYIAEDVQKIVFSKDKAFPPPNTWCPVC